MDLLGIGFQSNSSFVERGGFGFASTPLLYECRGLRWYNFCVCMCMLVFTGANKMSRLGYKSKAIYPPLWFRITSVRK